MAVQLIIDGQHITDVLAQVQQLAEATGGASTKKEAGATSGSKDSTTSAPSPKAATSTEAPATGGKTEAKLSREEQDAAVEQMIEAGAKDIRYESLTKGRQKTVDEGIAAKEAAEEGATEDDDLDNMFDDEPTEEVVTSQTIRDLMGKLGKDADGKQNQDNLLKIRDILVKNIPKGEEVKVGNIPEVKLAAVYADMKKLDV